MSRKPSRERSSTATRRRGTLLGYAPRYEPEAAVLESVRWLVDHDELRVACPANVGI